MIRLKQVIPEPLADNTELNSELWRSEVLLERGKMYNIYAPSGKGKSTFIHIIYGIRKDFSGDVEFDGQSFKDYKEESLAGLRQNKLSIVFQDLRLFPALSAMENIKIKSELVKPADQPDIYELARKLGVEGLLNRETYTLSYGERQRIAIIRALMQPFDMLLLDEPFSHLDKENIQKAWVLIRNEASRRQAGIVITSLNPDQEFTYDFKYRL